MGSKDVDQRTVIEVSIHCNEPQLACLLGATISERLKQFLPVKILKPFG